MLIAEQRLSEDGLAVLLFHGVIPRPRQGVRNYTGKHVVLDEFVACLRRVLAAGGAPVSLAQVRAWLAGDAELPARAFLITFDDGFANNATVAAPALASLGIPAVFYTTTWFLSEGAASWTDVLEYGVESSLRPSVDAPGIGSRSLRSREERIALLDELRGLLKNDPSLDPYEYGEELLRRLGVGEFVPDPDLDLKLSWEQLRALDADAAFAVGGHSHTHRTLAFLEPEELAVDLDTSLGMLAAQLGHPIDHFSYPEGTPNAYSDAVIAALIDRGVTFALTTRPEPVHQADDPMRLARFMVA